MPKYSILMKLAAILFGALPFFAIGLFFIAGGPDPGSAMRSPFRFVGIPFLLIGVYWALPGGLLLKVKPGIDVLLLLYALPGAFAGLFFLWLILSTETPSVFPIGLVGLAVLGGIGSAAWYHVRVWKKEDEDFNYVKSY